MKGISSSGMKKQTSSQSSSSSRPKLKDSFVTGTLIAKRFWKHLNVIPFFREKPAGKCFLALSSSSFLVVFSWSAILDFFSSPYTIIGIAESNGASIVPLGSVSVVLDEYYC